MGKYADTIVQVFENKLEDGYDTDEEIPFKRRDIEAAMDEIDVIVRNVPDIPYTYRSRRSLPERIQQHGYNAVVIDDQGSADAVYLFTREEQLIHLPDDADRELTTSKDELPDPVEEYIGTDEQGVLTQVRYASLLDEFTKFECYHLQSHMRMRMRNREAELDDLYIGVDKNGERHALAVEAKGKGETLNKNQLIRNTRAIEQKTEYPDSTKTLAVKLDKNGFFYIFEFDLHERGGDDEIDTNRVWQYDFVE